MSYSQYFQYNGHGFPLRSTSGPILGCRSSCAVQGGGEMWRGIATSTKIPAGDKFSKRTAQLNGTCPVLLGRSKAPEEELMQGAHNPDERLKTEGK